MRLLLTSLYCDAPLVPIDVTPGTPPRPWNIPIMSWFGVLLVKEWVEMDCISSLRMKPLMELNILVYWNTICGHFNRFKDVIFFSTTQLHTTVQNMLKNGCQITLLMCWNQMKVVLKNKDTASVPGLKTEITKLWVNMDLDYFLKMADSMPKRIRDAIAV